MHGLSQELDQLAVALLISLTWLEVRYERAISLKLSYPLREQLETELLGQGSGRQGCALDLASHRQRQLRFVHIGSGNQSIVASAVTRHTL